MHTSDNSSVEYLHLNILMNREQNLSTIELGGSGLHYTDYIPLQGILFQVSHTIFFVSYLIPTEKQGSFFMHCLLVFGFLLYSLWAWNVIKSPQVFGWCFSFMVINAAQALYTAYKLRPVTINREMEAVYKFIFYPLNVPRDLFKKLMSIEFAQCMSLHTGEAYAMCHLTKTDRLGLLISGKAIVISEGNFLHSISPMEFLDSPEFESSQTTVESKFKVSIMATETCRYIFWQRSSLEYLFVKDPYLCTVMSCLIARDITNKLFNMNQTILSDANTSLDIRLPSLASHVSTHNA